MARATNVKDSSFSATSVSGPTSPRSTPSVRGIASATSCGTSCVSRVRLSHARSKSRWNASTSPPMSTNVWTIQLEAPFACRALRARNAFLRLDASSSSSRSALALEARSAPCSFDCSLRRASSALSRSSMFARAFWSASTPCLADSFVRAALFPRVLVAADAFAGAGAASSRLALCCSASSARASFDACARRARSSCRRAARSAACATSARAAPSLACSAALTASRSARKSPRSAS